MFPDHSWSGAVVTGAARGAADILVTQPSLSAIVCGESLR